MIFDRNILQNGFVPIVVILLVIGVLGGGAVAVQTSQKSIPGDTLYPLKELTENVRIATATNPQKAQVYLDIISEKNRELESLQQQGAGEEKINKVLNKLQEYNQRVGDLLEKAADSEGDISKEVEKLKEESDKQKKTISKLLENASDKTREAAEQSIKTSEKTVENAVQQSTNSSNSNSGQNNNTQGTSTPTPSPVSTNPTVKPTTTPISTPIPTASPKPATPSPTSSPTPVPTATPTTSAVYIQAYQHIGNMDYTVSGAKVIVKSHDTGEQLGYGFTDSSGTSPRWRIAEDTKIDVYLYPPNSPNTTFCGSTWSVDTGPYGTTQAQNMRIYSSDTIPCIRE